MLAPQQTIMRASANRHCEGAGTSFPTLIFLDFEHPTYLPLAAFANNHEDLVFQVVGKIDAAQLQ